MIVSDSTQLNILLPSQNKLLKEVLKDADLKQLLTNNKALSVKEILNNLFTTITKQTQSNQSILNLLKDAPIFKELGSFPQNLSLLLQSLPQQSSTQQLASPLQKLLTQIHQVSPQALQESILNSGIFLEAKLAQAGPNSPITPLIQNDIKAILLQLQTQLQSKDEGMDSLKHIDKLLNQIDYYQLLSLTSSSNYIYIPFMWDLLKDGSLNIKKIDEERFYCQIKLELKTLGNIDIHLYLYDNKNLELSIFIEDKETKNFIQEHLITLRQAFKNMGMTIEHIELHELSTKEEKKTTGYEQKEALHFGLNIKA